MFKQPDYSKICFVIMPFGKKMVDDKEIDFDSIYQQIFKPAIDAVSLPAEEGGGKLIPRRTDQDYFSANIDTEMFLYLQYSRFAFVDITGLNANVFYELGVRHHAYESGTVIFRQMTKQPPPFDISHIKAFSYQYEPLDQVEISKNRIVQILTESLEYNRIDSPVQVALQSQQKMSAPTGQTSNLDKLLIDATNAIRNDDFSIAIEKYKSAAQLNTDNPVLYQELGLLLKKEDRWKEAVSAFQKAVSLSADYGEAWRELGIAQNKLFNLESQNSALLTGEESLLRAIQLNPNDFDAYASLGGVYKRQKQYDKAAAMYSRSLEVSHGHPYPLVNALVLQVREKGLDSLTGKQKLYMKQAEMSVKKQVADAPPYNAPWSFYDLAIINLLSGKADEALAVLQNGLPFSEGWQLKSNYETLRLLEERKEVVGLPALLNCLKELVE